MTTPQEIEAWKREHYGEIFIYHPNSKRTTLGMTFVNFSLLVRESVSIEDIASELRWIHKTCPDGFKSPLDRLVNGVPRGYIFESGRIEVEYGDWDHEEGYKDEKRTPILPRALDDVSWKRLLERINRVELNVGSSTAVV